MLGQQTFDALGARWTLFLGNAAQCAIEEHYGKSFFAVVADAIPLDGVTPDMLENQQEMMKLARGIHVSSLRDIAYFGLVKAHPDITVDQVSDLIDDVGSARFGELLGRAIAATQDHGAKEGGAGAAPGKPVKATRPTRAPRRRGPG